MSNTYKADIVIFGAGIAGLWLFRRLKDAGYNALLLETNAIGGGQSIASQGIIHSGLKYAFAGKINSLAKNISAMPDRWRDSLSGDGEIDLSDVNVATESQLLMIPSGFMGGLIKLVTKKALGGQVREVKPTDWPGEIKSSGFKGQVVYMDEPVLDVPNLIESLASPYRDSIKTIDMNDVSFNDDEIQIGDNVIAAQQIIFTSAASNIKIAEKRGHTDGLAVQHRPLLMGMMDHAPFPLFAHLVGSSDKPVATITTHETKAGSLVWYLGAQVAEREKESYPQEVYNAADKCFSKYLPKVDFSQVKWAVLPIDRVEGKSETEGWMPDTPVVHSVGINHYCWPTKLTFAPMLADKIMAKIAAPSGDERDWSFLQNAPLAQTPWDEVDDWKTA